MSEINTTKNTTKQEKERLAKWISKEITSREYTDKEMKSMLYFSKTGQNEKIWKILLKGHKCPASCYCQKPARTWQEKIQKGQFLLQLAEQEGEEAEKLRVRKGTELLLKHFNSNK